MRVLFPALALLALAAPAAIAAPQQQQDAPHSSVRIVSSAAFARSPGGATLFDVREPAEWADTGMPANSHGVSLSNPDFVQRVLAEVGGDKSKPVAVICKSGTRSTKAADKLAAAGFSNITNIGDGMMGRTDVGAGWLGSGLPVSHPAPAQ